MLQLEKESLGRLSRLQLASDHYPEGLSTTDTPADQPFPPPVGADLPARQALSCCRRSCG